MSSIVESISTIILFALQDWRKPHKTPVRIVGSLVPSKYKSRTLPLHQPCHFCAITEHVKSLL